MLLIPEYQNAARGDAILAATLADINFLEVRI
jgi:hypothetical protein